jgi:uncharacterized protein DUF4331
MKLKHAVVTLAVALCASAALTGSALAASHREAPSIANDPTADNTDFYLFRSWTNPGNVVFILNVNPVQEPSGGPNYFNFGDDVLYRINVDTNADGREDLVYEIRFKTEIRGPLASLELPLALVALPPITALDGAGSEGLTLRQSYTVTQVRNGVRADLGTQPMYAVPSRAGPLTMPDYEALAAQGIYSLANGGKVFAGQRDESFYIDLGGTFDTLNLRRTPPVLTAAEDANDAVNAFGVDTLSGFNVSSIAIEVPIGTVTADAGSVIGAYASTERQRVRVLLPKDTIRHTPGAGDGGLAQRAGAIGVNQAGPFAQVSRMGNPLVNEVIIGLDQKDRWNTTDPADEAQFVNFYLNSRLATAINLRFGTNIPTTHRSDLVNALLKYPSQPQTGTCGANDCAELLRLNLAVAPTPPASQKRLGVLAGDNAGWPNGRRPNDDVTDIALRVVAGKLIGTPEGNLALGDGVNFNIGSVGGNLTANGIYTVFPYLPTPHDGRNRRHVDCGEAGANPCN